MFIFAAAKAVRMASISGVLEKHGADAELLGSSSSAPVLYKPCSSALLADMRPHHGTPVHRACGFPALMGEMALDLRPS